MADFKKTRLGRVMSHAMDKTAVVEIVRKVEHPVFHKYYSKRKKLKVHDPRNVCVVGDQVLIQECRPVSKEKHWVLREVLKG